MMKRLLGATVLVALLSGCGGASVNEDNIPSLSSKEQHLIQMAKAVEQSGNRNRGMALYQQAAELSEGQVVAHLALAERYTQQKEHDKAVSILKIASTLQPSHPQVNMLLGKSAMQDGDGHAALGYFDIGLKRHARHMNLLNGRGVALDMLGKHKEAQQSYRNALKYVRSQRHDFVYSNWAMSYLMTKEYDKAIELLENIDGVDDSQVMRHNLSLAYGLQGNIEAAQRWAGDDLTAAQMTDNIEFYRNYNANSMVTSFDGIIPMLKPVLPEVSEE